MQCVMYQVPDIMKMTREITVWAAGLRTMTKRAGGNKQH